jgi:hypothetical protein
MAECAYCKAETWLFDNDMPVCVRCSAEDKAGRRASQYTDQILAASVRDIERATARVSEANHKFSEVTGQFHSGSHPNGAQEIKNASNELTVARKELMTAHKRLNEFIKRRIVPEGLKRSGHLPRPGLP